MRCDASFDADHPTGTVLTRPSGGAAWGGPIVRAVNIPDWFVWIALVLAALQVLGLLSAVRRLRGCGPGGRSKARLDVVDSVASLLLFGGLLLTLAVTESWLWLTFVGIALMTAVYAVKGVRLLRARRRPTV